MSSEDYDLKPSKEAYQAVKADVTPVSAYKELIDNAFDNWRRVLDGLDPLEIEIEYHEGEEEAEDEVIIRDHSGGVEEDNLQILFALGQSNKGAVNGSIGAYGVGAKKAIVNLGNEATIRSRDLYADNGFGFTIDEQWLNDDSDWTVDKEEHDDIESGVTEIRVSDLNTPWEKYRDDLLTELAETYQRFLRHDEIEGLEKVSIIVREFDSSGEKKNVERIDPPDEVDWSFTPVDGLYPRRYKGIELHSQEFDQEVTLNITVGLMRKASAEIAGADIFCQNRKVLSAVRDERAGFKTGSGSNRLGAFNSQHRQLKMMIEFETEGDAKTLPWDAQKSDIDEYDRVARAAYSWVRRIARPYHYAAGDFDTVPTQITQAYERDDEYAVTEHLDEPYDYSGGRKRVTHKAGGDSDNEFPEAEKIGDRADVTALLGVYSPGDLPNKFTPAYRAEFVRIRNDDYDTNLNRDAKRVEIPSDAVPTADVPAGLSLEGAEDVRDDLQNKASQHATATPPERLTGLDPWKQEAYDLFLRQAIHKRVEEALEDDDRENESVDIGLDTDWSNENATVDLDELETIDADSEEEVDGESRSPSGVTQSDTDEAGEGSDSDFTDIQGDVTGDEDSSGGTTVRPSGQVDPEPGAGQDGSGLSSGDRSDDEGQVLTTEDSGPAYGIQLSEEEWKTVVDGLGLGEDASQDDVREELLDKISLLQQLAN